MHWLEKHWYRITWLHLFLWPLSQLFQLLVWLRYNSYKAGILKQIKLPVPVLVVGNITVGGSGKTPLVLHLAQLLKKNGWHPGIISRGYGGKNDLPSRVEEDSDVATVGDEPLLLKQRSGCPVVIGQDRVATGRVLLHTHPHCDVLLCDDGLQHYHLQRDIELAVFDERGAGNGFLLPAGPLRERLSRLQQVDAVILNSVSKQSTLRHQLVAAIHDMNLVGHVFYNLKNPAIKKDVSDFADMELCAVAGLGYPQRFFEHVRALGLQPLCFPFPDHHAYQLSDLVFPNCEAILMTEKDAVKCAKFNLENIWVLKVDAVLDSNFEKQILHKLRNADGCTVT